MRMEEKQEEVNIEEEGIEEKRESEVNMPLVFTSSLN